MSKKKRKASRAAQLLRRKADQKLRQEAAERDRLFALSPGGSRQHPLVVTTPAVIESKAAARPCPQCAGVLQVKEHVVDLQGGETLRVVHAQCLRCHAPRKLFFRVETPLAN